MSPLNRRRGGLLVVGGLLVLVLWMVSRDEATPDREDGPADGRHPDGSTAPAAPDPGETVAAGSSPRPARSAPIGPASAKEGRTTTRGGPLPRAARSFRGRPPRPPSAPTSRPAPERDPGFSFDPPVGVVTGLGPGLALLTLEVDGTPRGEVPVTLVEGRVLATAGELRRAGFPLPLPVDSEVPVDLSTLPGVREVVVDEKGLLLDVEVDPSHLERQVVRVEAVLPPPDTDYEHPATGWFNHSIRLVDFDHVETFGELGLSAGPARLRSDLAWTPGDEARRGLTALALDLRARRSRVVIGDAVVPSGPLGGGGVLGGIQVGRAFDIDPYLPLAPRLTTEALATGPSTLEVYVNDRLVERSDVPAGPLDVQDIPLTPGAGETRVVLRDALGREQSYTWRGYLASGVISPGLHDWSWAVGLERASLGTDSFDYAAPVVVGRHRYGVSRRVTPGARFEGRLDGVSATAEVVTDVTVGEVDLAAGGSAGEEGLGAAGSVSWGYSSRRLGLATWTRLTSPEWTTLGNPVDEARALVDVGGSVGVSVGSRVRFSVGGGAQWKQDGLRSDRAGASFGVQLPRALQLSTTGTWSQVGEDEPDFGLLASLAMPIARRTLGTVRGEQVQAGQTVGADVRRALPVEGGYGYQVGAQAGATTQALAAGDLRTSVGQASARVDLLQEVSYSDLGWSGSLVAGGGDIFYTSPVTQSFAIVRAPGAPRATVRVNQQPAGRTDRDGNMLVHGLLPYYGNVLSIDAADVPLGVIATDTERAVAPGERSGAVVVFELSEARWVRGKVADGDALLGAELVLETPEGELSSPVGHGGAFEFTGLGVGVWEG